MARRHAAGGACGTCPEHRACAPSDHAPLFPDVPAIIRNGIDADEHGGKHLGLGNAATPLGLRAMRDLETLNPQPGVATNAMCTFLAVNPARCNSSRQLQLRSSSQQDRHRRRDCWHGMLANACAARSAIISVKCSKKLPWVQVKENAAARKTESETVAPGAAERNLISGEKPDSTLANQ